MLTETLGNWLSYFFPAQCPFCGDEPAVDWGVCMDCETSLPWLEPPWCAACGRPLDAGGAVTALCGDCTEHRPAFDRAFSAVAYEESVQTAVTRLKYGADSTLGAPLGAVFERLLPASVNPFLYDVVTGVPMHATRLRKRGFNQATLLAATVAHRFGLPLERRLLVRGRATVAQAGLNRAGRLTNLAAAFRVRKPKQVLGRRVLLVDDVFTTGATLEACALALKEAGAAQVHGLTLARALPGRAP